MHERITAISRELLMQIKELAEEMDLEVLHGIVDCLWVRGAGDGAATEKFKQAVEEQTASSRRRRTTTGSSFCLWQTEAGPTTATSGG